MPIRGRIKTAQERCLLMPVEGCAMDYTHFDNKADPQLAHWQATTTELQY